MMEFKLKEEESRSYDEFDAHEITTSFTKPSNESDQTGSEDLEKDLAACSLHNDLIPDIDKFLNEKVFQASHH